VGNPLRKEFLGQEKPADRFDQRQGNLRLLVVGGSLGAQALNEILPKALALIEPEHRPEVIHQSGARQLEALQNAYAQANVQAQTTVFIEDTASAYAWADLVICRAGASTVTELAAIGVAALLIPFPHAVDDHQTKNAQFLSAQQAAWTWPQSELNPAKLADWLQTISRPQLLQTAERAYNLRQTDAVATIVKACEEVLL
jgi:UDP-N-acetylglucosamine--N-acetylmuramyl-(pentapeptide) pyrophosphoryl-undecaprenol N-acetylglucosamine transferase